MRVTCFNRKMFLRWHILNLFPKINEIVTIHFVHQTPTIMVKGIEDIKKLTIYWLLHCFKALSHGTIDSSVNFHVMKCQRAPLRASHRPQIVWFRLYKGEKEKFIYPGNINQSIFHDFIYVKKGYPDIQVLFPLFWCIKGHNVFLWITSTRQVYPSYWRYQSAFWLKVLTVSADERPSDPSTSWFHRSSDLIRVRALILSDSRCSQNVKDVTRILDHHLQPNTCIYSNLLKWVNAPFCTTMTNACFSISQLSQQERNWDRVSHQHDLWNNALKMCADNSL